jgi:hypothetical protein
MCVILVMGLEAVMSTEERLTILREAAPNTWIAFSADEERIVARGATFQEAFRKAEESGEADPILTLIPPTWAPALLKG